MPLHLKHRPKDFTELEGNTATVNALQTVFARESDFPHAILLTGAPGTGKTSTARIIANMLGCVGMDYREYDIGDLRGIDNIRDIRNNMSLAPMEGKVKVYTLDECFIKGTMVSTSKGNIPIESVKEMDMVLSMTGLGLVLRTFKKQIPVDRLVKVNLSNGTSLVCSDGHEFITNHGWIHAIDLLKGDVVFCLGGSILSTKEYERKHKNVQETRSGLSKKMQTDRAKTLHPVQKAVCSKKGRTGALRTQLLHENTLQSGDNSSMQVLRETRSLLPKQQVEQCILREKLSCKGQNDPPRIQEDITGRGCEEKIHGQFQSISENRGGNGVSRTSICTDEADESLSQSIIGRKGKPDKAHKRDVAYLAGSERRKRIDNSSSENACHGFGMENGSCCSNKSKAVGIPDLLQIGYWKPVTENWNRSGRESTPMEHTTCERHEKGGKIKGVGVDSVEIFQQGDSGQSSGSFVGDNKETRCHIELYDIEVAGHPSYFANGVLVHNCHALTGDAQKALLKSLEDTPKHVYFILCTTDPEQLSKAILSRCMTFTFESLPERNIIRLLKKITKLEGVEIPEDVLNQIAIDCLGSARTALVILDKIIDLPPDQMKKAAEQRALEESKTLELCRALMNPRASWSEVAKIINGLTGTQPEQTRRTILGYAVGCIRNGKENGRAFNILDTFKGNYYDTKDAGLWHNCYAMIIGSR